MNETLPQLIHDSSKENQKPTLTIVTLCYNTGRYVVEGMNSLLQQLNENVEHVVLDDCSHDDSVQSMVDFATINGYPVRIYANPRNLGITESKSRILGLAKGQFIAGCADDIFLKERVEHDLELIRTLPKNVAGFYSLVLPFSVGNDGERHQHDCPIGELRGLKKQTILTPNELTNRLRQGNFIPAMGVCLRKSVYESFPQDTSYFIEDYPTWAKLAKAGYSLLYSPKITTLYRRSDHSVQKTHALRVEIDTIRVQLEILEVNTYEFNEKMKKMWFRIICDADQTTIEQISEICRRTSNSGGPLLFLAKLRLPHRIRWVISNYSLKLNLWRYL